MRLFIGIPLPESCQSRLAAIATQLGDLLNSRVKWVEPENGHVTLRFLGEVEENTLARLERTLGDINFPSFHMRFGGCHVIPSFNHPRVLWAEAVKGAQTCGELSKLVDQAVADAGLEAKRKVFKAHVTLGRVKKLRKDNWEEYLSLHSGLWPGFKVDKFVLWQSELTPTGPIYTPLKEFHLT